MLSKLKSLGPGLLYAGAAIGVSHLVQSTKAGAHYGYILIIAVVLAHILKYPFFVLGPRYTNLTGETLIKGYKKVGKWALYLVAVLTFVTMFTVQAAVTVVTAGLTTKLTGIVLDPWIWSTILLTVCFLILRVGSFKVLDNLMKIIMIVLALSTVLAFVFSFQSGGKVSDLGATFSLFNSDDSSFLIGFLGWMPAPLDIAIWHSIWTASHYKNSGKKTLEAENFDFKIGFFGTCSVGHMFSNVRSEYALWVRHSY